MLISKRYNTASHYLNQCWFIVSWTLGNKRKWNSNRISNIVIQETITWTNVDWSSMKSSDIHIRAISHQMPQPSITKICLQITCLKFHSNFPGANELTGDSCEESIHIGSPIELYLLQSDTFGYNWSICMYMIILWRCDWRLHLFGAKPLSKPMLCYC